MLLIKNAHMLVAATSVAMFCFRFMLLLTHPEKLKQGWLKFTPHIIDTILFVLGISLMIQFSLYPVQVSWMSEKLLAVVAYIFTGYYTLKLARNNTMRIIGFLGAMGWVVLIARIAITKQNFLF